MKPRSGRLILASASPRRGELLARLGVPFDVVPAQVVEFEQPDADPRLLVSHNARIKAAWVADRHPENPVLGADTTVCVDRIVLNKPVDLDDARRMLRLLSGREHEVLTAVCLITGPGAPAEMIASSRVRFHPLSDAVIEAHLQRVSVLDKAGAYALQQDDGTLIAGLTGSPTTVIGLPLIETEALLRARGLLS
jgi:septum formation protein